MIDVEEMHSMPKRMKKVLDVLWSWHLQLQVKTQAAGGGSKIVIDLENYRNSLFLK